LGFKRQEEIPTMLKKILCALLTAGLVAWIVAERASAQESSSETKAATPEAQAAKIYRVIRDQDYKAMFYLMAFTTKGKATLSTADQFALDVRKGYESGFKTPEEKEVTDRIFRSIADIMVGEPVITDDKAVIPTSAKITANGQTKVFKGKAHLIKDEGTWKLDLTIDEDAEKAMAQRVQELFGDPEKSS
jgi:hypothetical protein